MTHENELDYIHKKIAVLTNIIKDNQLHEKHCVAFAPSKDHAGPFGFLASAADKYCHCWLDKDNRAPEGEGFGLYHIKNDELSQEKFYLNNYYAVEDLLKYHPELSKDPKADNYWRKTYYVLPVKLQPAHLTPNLPESTQ